VGAIPVPSYSGVPPVFSDDNFIVFSPYEIRLYSISETRETVLGEVSRLVFPFRSDYDQEAFSGCSLIFPMRAWRFQSKTLQEHINSISFTYRNVLPTSPYFYS
jgi:hypothetical protein